MSDRPRNARGLRALLGIAVFACWLGGAIFHFHVGDGVPDCKVCQALQANQADAPVQASAPQPATRVERVAPLETEAVLPTLLLVPTGRAPPLA